jgi:predicted GIY-YIG superfamily endonuclease
MKGGNEINQKPLISGGVYKLWFKNSPAYYYGSTKDFDMRIASHAGQFKIGKHIVKKLQEAFDMNGGFEVEIVSKCYITSAIRLEEILIRQNCNDVNCCNTVHKIKAKPRRIRNAFKSLSNLETV